MLLDYLPILILVILAALFAAGSVLLSSLLGPRRPDPEKLSPYECGVEPVGTARERFSVKFYLVAMLFIIFDMEIVFLYPWAVVFQQLRLFGLMAMGSFLLVLLVGYFYVWQKGGLEWD
jgi:NADH-quinone oxidoreductase subunit A